jgi:2,3-bisphosphoglycerate-independent phosphoglycerate mutase
LAFLQKEKYGEIATVVGRYYAMDHDKRWERVKIAVDGLVKSTGEKVKDVANAIKAKYQEDKKDDFLKPLIVDGDAGRIKG